MMGLAQTTAQELGKLVGLSLIESGRAVDMRMFQFGSPGVPEYALHVQCAWRVQSPQRIVTGRHDMFEPAEAPEGFDWDAWDWTESTNTLQDRLVAEFLSDGPRLVEEVVTDAYGGAVLSLAGGYSIALFPASQDEAWRLFRPGSDEPHFVVSGGKVEKAQQDNPADDSGHSA
jgi:hypothetical protein